LPDIQMPPRGKLADSKIKDIEAWIAMGAPDPREKSPDGALKPTVPEPSKLDAARKHWAYQPIADPKPPDVMNAAWPKNDIDRFVLAKLEANRLSPAKE